MKEKHYIDLHLHLDGAITPEIAKKLAEVQHIELPFKTEEELESQLTLKPGCTSLNDFLQCFKLPVSLLKTKEGVKEAVRLVSDNIQKQGVVYAELRFAPSELVSEGFSQKDAIEAAIEGLKLTSLKTNLIVCFMRGNQSPESLTETLELVHEYLVEDGGVVALDIAGAEALYPLKDYEEYFKKAREYNIPFTIHAGEADGAHSVKTAIEYGARRIGHGVRANEDEEVLKMLNEKKIFLEMCPTSNLQTHAIDDMSKYPLIDYLKMGIPVTVNSDDMAIENTTMEKEFEYLEGLLSLNEEQEKKIIQNSINAAFTSEKVKEELRNILL